MPEHPEQGWRQHISTAEDPAEINLPGVNQVNVDDRAGLTFPVALKAFLRQDPDIIMVGEIRDLETAEIAIKAAQTGHMVLSTLHTNDAPQTLTRLMNMGVPTFNIASSILLITAQRLARRLCNCKKAITVPDQTLLDAGYKEADLDGSWTLYGPGGCDRCKGSRLQGTRRHLPGHAGHGSDAAPDHEWRHSTGPGPAGKSRRCT